MEQANKEDENEITKKAYEKLGISNAIIIEYLRYTYKTKLKNKDKFVYRCENRKCKAQVTLDKDNLLKILAKNKDSKIEYEVGKNIHSYNNKKENKIKEIQSEKILIDREIFLN